MVFKGVVFVTMLGIVASEYAFSSQHINKYDGHHDLVDNGHGHHDYYTYPKYDFEYKVNDPHTHDHKIQTEQRDGDHVDSYYSVHKGDEHSGFSTSVKRYIHRSGY